MKLDTLLTLKVNETSSKYTVSMSGTGTGTVGAASSDSSEAGSQDHAHSVQLSVRAPSNDVDDDPKKKNIPFILYYLLPPTPSARN